MAQRTVSRAVLTAVLLAVSTTFLRSTPRRLSSLVNLNANRPATLDERVAMSPVIERRLALAMIVTSSPNALRPSAPGPDSSASAGSTGQQRDMCTVLVARHRDDRHGAHTQKRTCSWSVGIVTGHGRIIRTALLRSHVSHAVRESRPNRAVREWRGRMEQ